MSTRLLAVVGARPNFVKVAPVLDALRDQGLVEAQVLHTGQHYDRRMSGAFLEQLGFPEPAFHLGVGSGTHAQQTAAVLTGVEEVLLREPFDAVLVPGDVNSTLAAALAAVKLHVPVVHLEAGLRSGDWQMPEEVNRVLTDRMSDLLLTHSDEALEHLAAEGIPGERIAMVGNTMIDSLLKLLPLAREREITAQLGLTAGEYVLVTLHRPSLVDDPARLRAALDALVEVADRLPVILPMHPRTRARLGDDVPAGLRITEPLEYLDFAALQADARLVITDSGGVQEETSVLGVPCLTYRTTTERPVTTRLGTNTLVGVEPEALRSAAAAALAEPPPASPPQIPLWDGRAGARAAEAIAAFLDARRPLAHTVNRTG
jgi:UDP-N-acetylglucosamine 2-epimerase (non-hydrolysing)